MGLGALRTVADLKLWHAAGLPDRLPPLAYRLATPLPAEAATHFVVGWLTGSYRMSRYRTLTTTARPALVPPPEADLAYAQIAADATAFARDLINTPANDMGPAELAAAASDLAARHGARCEILVGDELKVARLSVDLRCRRRRARASHDSSTFVGVIGRRRG